MQGEAHLYFVKQGRAWHQGVTNLLHDFWQVINWHVWLNQYGLMLQLQVAGAALH